MDSAPLRQLTAVLVWTVTATTSPLQNISNPLSKCAKREGQNGQNQKIRHRTISNMCIYNDTALAVLAPDPRIYSSRMTLPWPP